MARKFRSKLTSAVQCTTVALLGLGLALAAARPAFADKVGVAAAVNPDAFSSLAGAPQSQLNIGKSIFFNERIKTTTSGLVQVLLVDGSTFTVGPDSDLVIDKFVYDSHTGTGQIAASFSKGVMRFVGGKISKADNAVTIKTPEGDMAIRGCIVLTKVAPSSFAAVLVYGKYLKMNQLVVYEPGNGIFAEGGKPAIKPANGAIINGLMAGLTNGNTQGNNNSDSQNKIGKPVLLTTANAQNLNEIVSDANTTQITDQAQKTLANTPPPPPPCLTDCGTPAGHLQGYAGGLYQTEDVAPANSGTEVPTNVDRGTLANWSANEVDFANNSDGKTFSANFRLHVGDPGSAQGGILMRFGDAASNPQTPHSFIDPQTGGLAADTGTDGITIFRNDTQQAPLDPNQPAQAALASNDFSQGATNGSNVQSLDHQSVPTEVQLPEFCPDCTFMKWGIFASQATFQDTNDSGQPVDRNVQILGWWVAGDIPAAGDLPFTGSASYSGDAVGTVKTDLVSADGWTTYSATGKMNMTWDFGQRSGDLKVSKFDQQHFDGGLTFQGRMCAPGVTACGTNTPSGNQFGGKLSGQLPASGPSGQLPPEARNLNGFALGSFARGPQNFTNGDPKTGKPIKGSTPQGVMGNWNVGNDHYKASGVFAGTHQVPTQ